MKRLAQAPLHKIRLIPLFVVLFLVLFIPITVYFAQQQQTFQQQAQTTSQSPQTGSRISWQGSQWYIQGVNVPWYNWACDFGCNANGGVSSAMTSLDAGFQKVKNANAHMVRWWVFPGDPWQITRDASGAPSGIDPKVYADFDAALQLANKYDLYYNFVLFSAATAPPRAWLTDQTQRAKLASVLGQLFSHYASNPRILSWEIYNEPEFQIWNNQIDQASVVDTAAAISQSVHTNSPGTLVTVGNAFADGIPMWSNANLDYYSPHWYDFMNGGTYCLLCNDYSYYQNKFGIAKPIVVGEMYAGDAGALEKLTNLYNKGYAGAWAWSLYPDHTNDKLAVDFNALQTFVSQHTDIGPRSNGSSLPTVSPTQPSTTVTPTRVPTLTPTPTSRPTATPTPRPITPTPTLPVSTSVPTQPVPTGSGGILGVTSVGRFLDGADSNFMNGSRFIMVATTKQAVSMSVHVGNIDTPPHNQYQVAIYSDSNGRPDRLVGHSQSGILKANTWNTIAISATIQAGKAYWFMYNTNGTNMAVNNMHYNVTTGYTLGWGTRGQTFGTWPTSFGQVAKQQGLFSMYVTFL